VAIYSPATAQAFRTVQLRGVQGVEGWAHGFHQYGLPGGFTGFGHLGDTLSFHANMVTVPQLGLGVFVAGNSETAARLAQRLPRLIVQRFYGGPRTLPAATQADLGRYAGVYWTERRAYSGLEKFVSLLSGRVVVRPVDGRLAIISPQGPETYAPVGAGRFQSLEGGQVSAFQIDGGRPVRWFAPWGGETFDRAGPLRKAETLALLLIAALIAAVATLVGLTLRHRRDFRQTSSQAQASTLQTAASVLWILSTATFALWATPAASDAARAVYDWPGPWLVIASACALVAALLSVGAVLLLPLIWRGGRRLDSWSIPRKIRFTATALIFLGLSAVLMINGALEPWSG
jgi:hypothetical protein